MANPEHVERLKRSIKEWNTWREEHPEIRPDLSDADLNHTTLVGADLNHAMLVGANFCGADLNHATLVGANFSRADFSRADLSDVNLNHAISIIAKFGRANLNAADFSHADLRGAWLSRTNLSSTNLDGATLNGAYFYYTIFAWIDLSKVKGLKKVLYNGPSSVDINSVILPHDEDTRLHFLRGVGFTETQIEYLPSLLTPRPIQYHSLFVSYAHQDKSIAERLYTDFRKHDVPCWFAPHELIPGDYYRHKIDEAINHHDKLVLVLSEHSIKSAWVQEEVETALKREESMDMTRQVLFPIRLDDTVMTASRRWISNLRFLRHIGDFTDWQDESSYQQAFTTLLQHLKVVKPLTP